MKNWIKYYYDIDVDNIVQSKNEYKFTKNGNFYSLVLIDRQLNEIKELYDLTKRLFLMNIPCHQMLLNKDNEIVTNINNKWYILMQKYVNSNDFVTIGDVINFSKKTNLDWQYKTLDRTNWKNLWEQKNDYFEFQISQIGVKYPKFSSTFGYYESVIENAIQLMNIYNKHERKSICVAHKRISNNMTLSDFYNPINFIIDYKVRDVAEYIKQKNNILEVDMDIIGYLFDTFVLQNEDKILFFIRILFPSFYFDLYEKVLNGSVDDEMIFLIIDRNKIYEKLMKNVYMILNKYVNFSIIDWLN